MASDDEAAGPSSGRPTLPDMEEVLVATDDEAGDNRQILLASDDEGLMLQTSESESSHREPAAKRRRYAQRDASDAKLSFLGKSVCRAAHQRLYAVSSSVLQQIRRNESGYSVQRQPQPKHPTLGYSMRSTSTARWPSVLAFFWYLYTSAAEILPTKLVVPAERFQKAKL